MSLGSIFDISATAMSAQSVRLNTTASNLANAQSAASSIDQVYRAREPVFQTIAADAFDDAFADSRLPAGGVRVAGIVESDAPLQRRYEPNHPMADEEGYVTYPNVNVVEEMTNMISASRSFQMNVDVMNAAKTMMQRVLTIGK